jgi:hypothetical protein
MCVDYTVRTDADVAGPYDTWQGRMTHGRCRLVVMWMNWHPTHGMFVANGMVTRGPINGHHVSPGQWFKTYVVGRTQPRDLRGKGKSFGKGRLIDMPTYGS